MDSRGFPRHINGLVDPSHRSSSWLGRKRDHTRDTQILEAAIDVLAEMGFDGMTIDMVAARAEAGKATIYRRWPSKADLVLDAVAYMKAGELDLSASPTRAPCAATSSP